jgi:hypothetical protein
MNTVNDHILYVKCHNGEREKLNMFIVSKIMFCVQFFCFAYHKICWILEWVDSWWVRLIHYVCKLSDIQVPKYCELLMKALEYNPRKSYVCYHPSMCTDTEDEFCTFLISSSLVNLVLAVLVLGKRGLLCLLKLRWYDMKIFWEWWNV